MTFEIFGFLTLVTASLLRVTGSTKDSNKSSRERYENRPEVTMRSGQPDLRVKASNNGPTGGLFAGQR